MSTTDRIIVFEDECKCGEGKFIIERSEPDHAWVRPSQRKWNPKISCSNCNKKYQIIERNNRFGIVLKEELKERQGIKDEIKNNTDKLFDREDVKNIINKFICKLSNFKNKIDIYRYLQKHHLYTNSKSTFYKTWESPKKWIEHNVFLLTLKKIIKALNISNDELIQEIEDIEKMKATTSKSLCFIGEPIYNKNTY